MLLLVIAHVDRLEHLSDVLRPREAEVCGRVPIQGCPPMVLRPGLLLLSDLPIRGGLQRHLIISLAHHDWLELKLERAPCALQGRLLWLEKARVQHRGLDGGALCLVVEGLYPGVLIFRRCQPCPLISSLHHLQGQKL